MQVESFPTPHLAVQSAEPDAPPVPSFTVAVLGDKGVGKTALLKRVEGLDILNGSVQLQLWENGDVYDRNLAKSFASLNGVIVCYDPTQPSSFKSVREWLRHVNQFAPPSAQKMIVATKADEYDDQRRASRVASDAQQLSRTDMQLRWGAELAASSNAPAGLWSRRHGRQQGGCPACVFNGRCKAQRAQRRLECQRPRPHRSNSGSAPPCRAADRTDPRHQHLRLHFSELDLRPVHAADPHHRWRHAQVARQGGGALPPSGNRQAQWRAGQGGRRQGPLRGRHRHKAPSRSVAATKLQAAFRGNRPQGAAAAARAAGTGATAGRASKTARQGPFRRCTWVGWPAANKGRAREAEREEEFKRQEALRQEEEARQAAIAKAKAKAGGGGRAEGGRQGDEGQAKAQASRRKQRRRSGGSQRRRRPRRKGWRRRRQRKRRRRRRFARQQTGKRIGEKRLQRRKATTTIQSALRGKLGRRKAVTAKLVAEAAAREAKKIAEAKAAEERRLAIEAKEAEAKAAEERRAKEAAVAEAEAEEAALRKAAAEEAAKAEAEAKAAKAEAEAKAAKAEAEVKAAGSKGEASIADSLDFSSIDFDAPVAE